MSMAAIPTSNRNVKWQSEKAPALAAESDAAGTSDGDAVVYPFVFCPPILPGCHYRLVRCDSSGARVLTEGRAVYAHPPLNLAVVRQTGARLGATEVHVWNGSARR